MAKGITAQEKEWQAESDAETLIRAMEIKKDKTRLKAATKVLEKKKEAASKAVATVKGENE